MADNFTTKRAEAIVAILRRYPNGATLADLARDLPRAPETRTLRSWVDTMVVGGLVTLEGTGDATVIRLCAPVATTAAPTPVPQPSRSPAPASNPAPAAAVSAPRTSPAPSVPSFPAPSVPSVPSVPSAAAATPRSGAPPTPAAASPIAPADPATDQMMLEAVQYVVAYGIVPETSLIHLQGLARKEGLSIPAAITFVDRLVALLTTLSAADAVATYGLSTAQYNEWVEHCSLAGYPRRGVAGSDVAGVADPGRVLAADRDRDTTPAPAARPPAPPPNPSVAAVHDRGAPAPAPRRHPFVGVLDAIGGAAGVADPGPLVPAAGYLAQPSTTPSTPTPNTTPAAPLAPAAAPVCDTPVGSGVPPGRRRLGGGAWLIAALAAGFGAYQARDYLPFASAPAATPGRATHGSTSNPQSAVRTPQFDPTPATGPIENRDSRIENSSAPQSAVRNPQFPPAPQFPPFPAIPGAYVLTAGRWLPLPRNGGQLLTIDDGRPMPAGAVGLLIFGGGEPPPQVPATDGHIACVGAIGWTAAQLARQPALRNEQMYPPLELARLDTDDSGARSTWWSELLPGIAGVGAARLPATLEHPAANVTLLRPAAPLPPGRYALCCGNQYFELAVE